MMGAKAQEILFSGRCCSCPECTTVRGRLVKMAGMTFIAAGRDPVLGMVYFGVAEESVKREVLSDLSDLSAPASPKGCAAASGCRGRA